MKEPDFESTYYPPDIEDYTDETFYPLLRRIPKELVSKHLEVIERNGYSNEEASEYLSEVIDRRKEVLTETVVSDTSLLEKIRDQKEAIFKYIETELFNDPESLIGAGMTARIKQFMIEDENTSESIPLAVKYLVTPTAMTLSVSAEHDMLLEVERIQAVEELEADAHLTMIKVPHPYFHHQNSEIQCYGMQLVDGFDLSKDLAGMVPGEAKDALVEKLAALDETVLENEIRTFYRKMHEYCLHGDMKPANLMVDSNGVFYIIDFGQSRLISDIPDKAREQLYVLQDDEIKMTIDTTRRIVREAKAIVAER